MFNALVLDEAGDRLAAAVRSLTTSDLPEGDVLVAVQYSSLNYKDGLAVTGKGKIIRGSYPFVPGIDLVGTVVASQSPQFAEGDVVVGTGWGLGELHWGGYSQQQRLRSDWLVPLPAGLSPKAAMVVGTAGLTAMLSVLALEAHGIGPDRGEVVVTGASGGVGSMAVALLGALGYTVVASTGSAAAHDYLRGLGAARVIDREELGRGPARPMDSARWAGAVDAVGGETLAAILSQLDRHGCVAACGLAGGASLQTTVFPFILRGVSLLGIDSNTCPNDLRRTAWERIAGTLSAETLDRMTAGVISLGEVPEASERILRGGVQGRLVVDVNR